ncbi:ComEA family DNA-binding protein [Cellvibrio fontiphilus]|uniref:ComEA family DNA-binding protein n=1 Tax=Cellvibrio fontiphilus TaxID=1815559 RepID=A0ABV7FGR7_9GAMM
MKKLMSILSVVTLGLAASFAVAVEPSPNPVVKAEVVAQQGAININTADVAELTKLKGIGIKKAEAIIAWREANGDFKSVDQLIEVKGIGEATLMQNRENIRI